MPRLGLPGMGLQARGTPAAALLSVLPVAGAILHLRGDAGISQSGSGVAKWLDQSGNGNDATQTVDANRPAFEATGGPNSTAAVTFDKSNTEHLELVGLTDASHDYTVFAVLNQTTAANDQIVLRSGTSTVFSAVADSGSVGGHDGTAWRNVVVAKTGEQLLTWRLDSSGTSMEVYRDSTLLGTGTYDGTWAWSDPRVGAGPLAPSSWNLNGKLAELIVFPTKLSDVDVVTMHAYLAARYALAFSPLSVAGLEFWYNADNVSLNGANVSAWPDQSGNARHLLQGTAARQPLFVTTGGPHGRGYIEFDNVQQEWLQVASWGRVQPFTMLSNALPTVASALFVTLWDGTAGQNTGRIYTGAGPNINLFAGVNLARTGYVANTWARIAAVYNGLTSSINTDDGVANTGAGGANNPGGLNVGVDGGGLGFGDPRIDELMGYSRDLNAYELTALDVFMTP